MVLASFSIHDFSHHFIVPTDKLTLNILPKIEKIPKNYMFDLQIEPYNININVLGLRSLVSPGLLPVKKPYIKFAVKSLLPSEQAKALQDVFTVPNEGGVDPNIRTTFRLKVNLPSTPMYVPTMTCTVFDKIYFDGMSQPIIGTFGLRVGDNLQHSRDRDNFVINKLKKINSGIENEIKNKKSNPDAKIGDMARNENKSMLL